MLLELLSCDRQEFRVKKILEDRKRDPVAEPQTARMEYSRARRLAELIEDFLHGNNLLVQQNTGRQVALAELQVVRKAGDVDLARRRAAHDLRTDAALPYEQALVDEVLQCPADGRARNAELFDQHLLVFDASARSQLAARDGLTQAL